MSEKFAVASHGEAADLVNYFSRARRVHDASARLVATGGNLMAYVGMLFPRGLLDRTPTVLGLRVLRVVTPVEFDEIVPLESLIARIDAAINASDGSDGPITITLPAPSPSIAWASITPPRDGWKRHLGIKADALKSAAETGVREVSEALPEAAGEAVVQKIRAEVWSKDIPKKKGIPMAAGFAADALGFLDAKSLTVHSVDNWVRLTSPSGYVLVRLFETPDFSFED